MNITWLDLFMFAPILGWPGLLIGAALGAWLWRRRRILGGVLGAAFGCLLWTGVHILTL